MATIRERNGTYQITVYSGFDLNGRRKRETTTFTPPKELSPKKKEKVVQAFAIDFENRIKIHTRGHSRVDDTGIQYQVGDYTLTRTMPEQLRVLFNLAASPVCEKEKCWRCNGLILTLRTVPSASPKPLQWWTASRSAKHRKRKTPAERSASPGSWQTGSTI